LGAFSAFDNENVNLLVRLFDVYIPIVLATTLVIYILLRAFVFRKQTVKETKKKGLSESEKSLGLGYAIPILFTAVAIIFGLVVYDITRTDLQVWVWVVIQVIIALGILLGTRFSSKAKSAKAAPPRPKQTLAAGAANLNFVLSIVFGATVSIMSFSFGASAIDSLRIWPEYKEPMGDEEIVYDPGWEVSKFEWSWFFESMLPALVLLVIAAVGIYLFITERNQSGSTLSTKKASSKSVAKTKTSSSKTAKKTSAGSKTTSKATAPRKRK
jgi:H+/gluconate symporter-like permease